MCACVCMYVYIIGWVDGFKKSRRDECWIGERYVFISVLFDGCMPCMPLGMMVIN